MLSDFPSFQWTRFWAPRDKQPDLSDDGYLVDPESGMGKYRNPDLVPYSALDDHRCIVLLGEPGSGKSHTMHELERAVKEEAVPGKRSEVLHIDLARLGDEGRLVDRITHASEAAQSRSEGIRLYLLLDSLDESPIPHIATLLGHCLADLPREGLYIRVACRTFDWPPLLEQLLGKLWLTTDVAVRKIALLRRVDVAIAATACGLDANAFLSAVAAREVEALAAKPISLLFLLDSYKEHGGVLPSTQVELYEEGCRWLCRENNLNRRATRRVGNLDLDERLAVASRIAAISMFCNRSIIARDRDTVSLDAEVLPFETFYGVEMVKERSLKIDDGVVSETLGTGLFTSFDSQYMRWAHQTYMEYLAARYLVHHHISVKHMLALLTCDTDPLGKVVPQLRDVAAWLATMDSTVRQELLQREPEVLLRSDVTAADVDDRKALVDALLQLQIAGSLLTYDRDLVLRYHKLAHGGLAEQLHSYIINGTSVDPQVRSLAIDIARECKVHALQHDLLVVVLDVTQSVHVREDATGALSEIADNSIIVQMRPVALTPDGNDLDDSIKGNALRALWPRRLITVEELLGAITTPKRANYLGSYRMFLIYELAAGLEACDLPAALLWLLEEEHTRYFGYDYGRVIGSILGKAVDHFDHPDVLELTAQLLVGYAIDPAGRHAFHHMDESLHTVFSKDATKRRAVALQVIRSLNHENRFYILDLLRNFVGAIDITWLLAQAEGAPTESAREQLADVVRALFDRDSVDQISAILESAARSPSIAAAFSYWTEPVELSSATAKQQRDDYYKYVNLQQAHQDELQPIQPPPKERIAGHLSAFEQGSTVAWWGLLMDMTLEPTSQVYGNELEPDITKFYGWQNVGEDARSRILSAATTYLLQADPDTPTWLGTTMIYRPAFSGFRALHLLLTVSPETINTLPPEVWAKWAPIVLAYPHASDAVATQQRLVTICYATAPIQIIDTAQILIVKESKAEHPLLFLRLLADCWDMQLGSSLLRYIQTRPLPPTCVGEVLGYLLEHQFADAQSWAEALVLQWKEGVPARYLAIAAGNALLTHAADSGWPTVWKLLQEDKETGRQLVLTAAQSHHFGQATISIHTALTEQQLADLFLFLSTEFPFSTDEESNGFVGERYFIARWRDAIPQVLTQRGTRAAVAALQHIAEARPDLGWMKWRIAEAQAARRQSTWLPLNPNALLTLCTDPQARLVSSGDQLLDVLLESLEHLQMELLKQETPSVVDLWSEMPRGPARGVKAKWRPKDENNLSDYVKRFLDRDLKDRSIIVNREVEIRRTLGDARGQRTDIHVDAIAHDGVGTVIDKMTVVIEVKGCWHRERDTAMQTQLVDRYLQGNPYPHGIYLVGRFQCSAWDDDDYRKGEALTMSTSEAQVQFDSQAEGLSQEGRRICAFVLDAALPEA